MLYIKKFNPLLYVMCRYQNYEDCKTMWGNISNGKWRTTINLDVLQHYVCKVGTDKHNLKWKKWMLRFCGLMEFFKSLSVTELIRLHPNIYKCPHNILQTISTCMTHQHLTLIMSPTEFLVFTFRPVLLSSLFLKSVSEAPLYWSL